MRERFLQIVLLGMAVFSMTCAAREPSYKLVKLASGKEIKVLGVGQMNFSSGEKALMLKYQTDLKIEDKDALQREVDEIWPGFRIDVENARLDSAIISANEAPTGGIISKNRAFNFVFKKASDGNWIRQ
jgi:hypothetical protein